MSAPAPRRRWRDGALVGALVFVRLLTFALGGPLWLPDSAGYARYASALLRLDPTLWTELDRVAEPLSARRTPGYPALLALAEALAGDAAAALVVALQIAAAAGALSLLLGALARLGVRWRWRALLALGLALGPGLWLDVAVLTDSLVASATAAACAIAVHAWLDEVGGAASATPGAGRGPRRDALAIGALLALICALRGNGPALAALLALPTLVALLPAAPSSPARLRLALALLVPSAALVASVMIANAARSGVAFYSTGAQVVALQPLYALARAGAPVFAGDDALDRDVRATTTTYAFADLHALQRRRFAAGLRAPALADEAIAAYFSRMPQHPRAALPYAAHNAVVRGLRTQLNPAYNLRFLRLLRLRGAPTAADGLGVGALLGGDGARSPAALAYLLAYAVGALAGVGVFALALLSAARAARALLPRPPPRVPRRQAALALTLALCVFGTLGALALLHLEPRYVSGLPGVAALLLALMRAQRPWA